MNHTDRLDWLADNIAWFSALDLAVLDEPVPLCPTWKIKDVVVHLATGLGMAYPLALDAAVDAPADQLFTAMTWPDAPPTGEAALALFDREMGRCLDTYRTIDGDRPSATYAGPGVAGFWFRRAAIETTLHRIDVAHALGLASTGLSVERAVDGIDETIDFALPLASALTDMTPAPMLVVESESGTTFTLGDPDAETAGVISAAGEHLLAGLWGRLVERVEVIGDEMVAATWMSLVESAFAGRG